MSKSMNQIGKGIPRRGGKGEDQEVAMAEFESRIIIARPVEEVFALLLDLENAQYFDPQVGSVRRVTPGPIGVGTSFEFREPIPPFGRVGRTVCTYTEIEAPERIVLDFQVGALPGSESYLFRPAGDATLLTTRGRMHLPLPLRVLSPVVARQGRRLWDTRLEWIKDWVEAGAPRHVPTWQPGVSPS